MLTGPLLVQRCSLASSPLRGSPQV